MKSACTRGAPRAGRVDGRAATACLCGAESPSPVFVVALVAGSRLSRGGGSDGVIFPLSVVQSLRLCKKRRICRRIHRHGGYYHYYDYVIAPRSGRCPAAATARPSEESVCRLLFSVVFQGSSTVPQRSSPTAAAVRVVPWYHWIGGRELVQEVASGNKVLRWLQRAQLIETLLPCRCVPSRLSRNRNQAALAPLGPASLRSPHVIIWFGLARRTPRK